MQLAELLGKTGLDVLGHLERQVTVPVIDGIQAQGDLIIIPADLITTVEPHTYSRWLPVPPTGVELVRGAAGNNPHTLVADPGTCEFTNLVRDPLGLAIAILTNIKPAYLIHPEHGATGIAPGRWLVRRQQELATGRSSRPILIAD